MAGYDAQAIATYFDDLGDGEWERLAGSVEAEVNLAVHTHYLKTHVREGWRVLEVGAGAGRFTIALAELGARIVVTDISPVQLELNRSRLADAGLEGFVESRMLLDVVDMSKLEDESFDCVVCIGGPLSYAMDRRLDAARECARVAKPGAPLLFGVMSLWGSVHKGLQAVLSVPPEANELIVRTGDISAAALPGHRHACHAFRGTEFRELLTSAGLEIEAFSAATCLTTGWSDRLEGLRDDEARWAELLELEIAACAEPGCVEAGPHMIAVARKGPRKEA